LLSQGNISPMLNKRFFTHLFPLAIGILLFSSFVSPATRSLDNDVLHFTNKFRKSYNKAALVLRDDLSAIARKHSQDMANGRKSFGHDGFKQRSTQVKRMFESCTLAENVAYGATSGKEVVDQWISSSPHRRNLLGDYNYIGIGIASDRRGRIYYTQIFVR
jgi:uncharacterized protein YkwD